MRLRALPRVVMDLASINRRFIADTDTRAALRLAARTARPSSAIEAAELRRAPIAARPFAGLMPTSLALASMQQRAQPARLNVVIGDVQPGRTFAGVHTALVAAAGLARRLGMPLRVVLLEPSAVASPDRTAEWIDSTVGSTGSVVVHRAHLHATTFSPDDLWLASHSRSAHALQVAASAGVVDARRVAYAIQDYEPGFSPWSTEWVTAAATYHAGFVPLVNSAPLARYLDAHEGLAIDPALVFAPAFDEQRLREAADSRRREGAVRVLFYARPSKPRNLFDLGVSALRATLPLLEGRPVTVSSAGEPHARVSLAAGAEMRGLGQLTRKGYFDELSRTDVVLSLQQSPHPSHLPLEAAISGARAVTNAFTPERATLHPRLTAVGADTAALAEALASAISAADAAAYSALAPGALGRDLDEVLDTAAELLLVRGD